MKMKVPAGFNNRKYELVTMVKLTLYLIIKIFSIYGRILIRKSKDKITVIRVMENENKSITNLPTLIVTKSMEGYFI